MCIVLALHLRKETSLSPLGEGWGFFLGLILERRGQILMEGELAAMTSPARKRLSESVEEVAGDGGEMIGVSNTKRAKVAVADGGMGSGSIIGLPKPKGRGAQQRLHRHQARQHHHQAPEGQAGGDPEGDEDCEKKLSC